jgi:alanine racemase
LEKLPPNIKIKTVFTHLSASENAEMDAFTKAQLEHLQGVKALLEKRMGYVIWAHGLNSSGIVRFPEYQMDMVRLGIGLYGLETPWDGELKSVAALYTTITQIHQVEAGAGIGYGQLDAADHPRRIATIAVGYADGLLRKFGRGIWGAWIHGEVAPFVGNICMDMAMLDVTHLACGEGDRVEIFGSNHSIKEMARRGETISYEILTTISQRVPRLFVGEF